MKCHLFAAMGLAGALVSCSGLPSPAKADPGIHELAVSRCIEAGRGSTADGELETCARITAKNIEAERTQEALERKTHGMTAEEAGSALAWANCRQAQLSRATTFPDLSDVGKPGATVHERAVARCMEAGRDTSADGDLETCSRITARRIETEDCVKEYEPQFAAQIRAQWIIDSITVRSKPAAGGEPGGSDWLGSRNQSSEGALIKPGPMQPPALPSQNLPGTPVYPKSACIGPVVNGVCEGMIQSTDPKPKRCYGEMLNGRCTGPVF